MCIRDRFWYSSVWYPWRIYVCLLYAHVCKVMRQAMSLWYIYVQPCINKYTLWFHSNIIAHINWVDVGGELSVRETWLGAYTLLWSWRTPGRVTTTWDITTRGYSIDCVCAVECRPTTTQGKGNPAQQGQRDNTLWKGCRQWNPAREFLPGLCIDGSYWRDRIH